MKKARQRILIVDSDVKLAQSLAALLVKEGAPETRIVHSAGEAVAAAAAYPPAIVFLDIDLPDKSGYQAALLLHQHPGLRATRLIALTASAEHLAREDARAAGFERYLVKPVIIVELQKVLRRRVGLAA